MFKIFRVLSIEVVPEVLVINDLQLNYLSIL